MGLEVKTILVPREWRLWKKFGEHPELKTVDQVEGVCWYFIPFPVLPVSVAILVENGISWYEHPSYKWAFHRKDKPEDEQGIIISKGVGPLFGLVVKILFETQ